MRLHRRLPGRLAATVLATAMIAIGLPAGLAAPANAASASDFDPGFLVSDADFFNGTALSAAQVDAFIAGMNKGCATGKTCLENYRETIKAKAATTKCAAIPAATKQTAGQIIAAVGKACGISPKAILVILQKEQSLVTATAPSATAFQASMGAGCPDTAPCDGKYAGFYENVYYGASLLKGYTLPANSAYTRYQAGKTSAIKYSPTTSCGTKQVYVKNQATHALYVYTPYTPNAASLAAYPSAVASSNPSAKCASYGNRNFWFIWTNWWGPTGSAGALAVDALYTKSGGSTGPLGKRVGSIVTTTVKGAGLYQSYEHGAIAWNIKNGAFIISGDLATSWVARISDFGWPKQSGISSTSGDGGTYQNFDSVLLVQPSGASVYTVWSGTRTQYLAAKGPDGPMGWPASYQAKDADGLYTQVFTAGTSYRLGTKTGFVATPLVAGFTSRGAVTGKLGWPTGFGTATTSQGGGTWQDFDKGLLMNSTVGTQAVYGATRTAFKALGGVAKVGWPLGSRHYVDDTKWLAQDFQKGTIVVKGSTSAFVATALMPTWVASGFTSGSVGKPTTAPMYLSGDGSGVYQSFSKMSLAKQDGSKVYRLTGLARTAWKDLGRANGTLGWPTSQPATDSKLKLNVQSYQRGVLIYSTTKYAAVGTNEWALAKKMGVGTGSLGWPKGVMKTYAGAGGGEYQKFASGTITWQKARGAIFVPSAIWTAFAKSGGAVKVGWPTGAATTNTKTGVTTQKFENGVITWSKSKGAVVTLK